MRATRVRRIGASLAQLQSRLVFDVGSSGRFGLGGRGGRRPRRGLTLVVKRWAHCFCGIISVVALGRTIDALVVLSELGRIPSR
jgi:hypothetical protein